MIKRATALAEKLIDWLGLDVFGRAFFALFLLLLTSLSAWLLAFLLAQQEPRATQIADRVVTAYHITQRAFRFTPHENHPALVMELATIGDTQTFPRELSDTYTPLPNTKFWNLVVSKVRHSLHNDPNIIIAETVNGEKGLWISLTTSDQEHYWLLIRYQALDISSEWGYWSAIMLILSLIGSSVIVLLANQPLNLITQTIRTIGRGETPRPLPENTGPRELRTLYTDINRMVEDLRQAENDRRVMLAGISHDLRTPLARMRLEVELSGLPEETQNAIDNDLNQVNHCINQLMEYSRPMSSEQAPVINVSEALKYLCRLESSYTTELNGLFCYEIESNLYAHISEGDLNRVVSNLIENARRYGKTENGEMRVELRAYHHHLSIYIDVKDHGKGVAPQDIPRILRPFSRGEQARTEANGSGLGLAICERLLKQAGGSLKLLPNEPSGLLCRIEISLADDKNIQLD